MAFHIQAVKINYNKGFKFPPDSPQSKRAKRKGVLGVSVPKEFFALLSVLRSRTADFCQPAEGGLSGRQAAKPPACLSYFLRFLFFDLWIKFGKMIVKV